MYRSKLFFMSIDGRNPQVAGRQPRLRTWDSTRGMTSGRRLNPCGDARTHDGTDHGCMSTSLQQRFRAWIAAPAYPWVTGGALTVGAVVELIAFPGSVTTTIGVLVSSASLMWRRSFPPVAVLTVAAGLLGFAGDVNLYISIMASGLIGCYTLGRNRVLHPAMTVAGAALGALCVNLVHINTWSRMELPVPALWEKGSLSLFTESFLLTVVIFGAVMIEKWIVPGRRPARNGTWPRPS